MTDLELPNKLLEHHQQPNLRHRNLSHANTTAVKNRNRTAGPRHLNKPDFNGPSQDTTELDDDDAEG